MTEDQRIRNRIATGSKLQQKLWDDSNYMPFCPANNWGIAKHIKKKQNVVVEKGGS